MLLTLVTPWAKRLPGLHARIGLALGALIMLGALALASALASYANSAFLAMASANVAGLGNQMARDLSAGMERFTREIQLEAASPALTNPNATAAELRRVLEGIQGVYPEFAHISVVDAETGVVFAATGGIFEGGNGSGRPVFEEGKKGLFVGDVHDAVRLAELLPKPDSGEPLRFLDIAAPIRDRDGKTVRVLASHLSWEWTRHLKRRVLAPVETSHEVQVMLIDTSGAVVLPPDAAVPVGTVLPVLPGAAAKGLPVRWADGQDYLTAEAPTFGTSAFKGLGWRVVVRQPMDVVLATGQRLRNLFMLGALLLGGVAAAVAWVVAGRIVKPVTDLARAAGELVAGAGLPSSFGQARGQGTEVAEVATVRDAFQRVTGEALERAERLVTQLDAIYRSAPVGLCAVDTAMCYLRANPLWCEAFGLDAEATRGQPLPDTAHAPELLAALARVLQSPGAGEACLEVETAGRQPVAGDEGADAVAGDGQGDGQGAGSAAVAVPRRFWQMRVAPLLDGAGTVEGATIVATDITAIKLAEQALRRADTRKNDFVAMLAHELRNPLAPILNAVQILEREPSPPQAKRMRDMIKFQAKHMVRLIDDLLEISRVNHNKIALSLEPLAVGEACTAAAEAARAAIDAKGQLFEVHIEEDLPVIQADRARIVQVIGNLLNNASKFTVPGGLVRLRARAHGNSGVQILVDDTGRGIAPELLPHVFELFTQGDTSLDRSEGGLGVGLAIVRNLVTMHGGEVHAQSDGPGCGSCFTVTLPDGLVKR